MTERYTGYKIIRKEKVLGVRKLDLPLMNFRTKGLWFTVPESLGAELGRTGHDFGGGLHGLEHAIIAVMPFHLMCDRWDLGGLSRGFHNCTGMPTVFVYDGFEGGIGICERAFDIFPEILRTAYKLIEGCSCDNGCPGCIYSPKCGNENRPLDKAAGLAILTHLLDKYKFPG